MTDYKIIFELHLTWNCGRDVSVVVYDSFSECLRRVSELKPFRSDLRAFVAVFLWRSGFSPLVLATCSPFEIYKWPSDLIVSILNDTHV